MAQGPHSEIEPGRAGILIAAVSEMPVHWSSDETLCAAAFRLALALDRPVYDCVYLALAQRVDAQLVTSDVRFANALAATEHKGTVVTLKDYANERR